ncbi:MAG: hypothetical protein M3548_07340 [Actinomycetota bacterium]|nr:hypothetical protein [Actinomycetota bacterium]
MATYDDAQGWGCQNEQRWPPPETPGIVTVGDRTFHRNEECSGYMQGVRNSIKHGRALNPIEQVTARQARERGKGRCNVCWKRWTAF